MGDGMLPLGNRVRVVNERTVLDTGTVLGRFVDFQFAEYKETDKDTKQERVTEFVWFTFDLLQTELGGTLMTERGEKYSIRAKPVYGGKGKTFKNIFDGLAGYEIGTAAIGEIVPSNFYGNVLKLFLVKDTYEGKAFNEVAKAELVESA